MDVAGEKWVKKMERRESWTNLKRGDRDGDRRVEKQGILCSFPIQWGVYPDYSRRAASTESRRIWWNSEINI